MSTCIYETCQVALFDFTSFFDKPAVYVHLSIYLSIRSCEYLYDLMIFETCLVVCFHICLTDLFDKPGMHMRGICKYMSIYMSCVCMRHV